MTEQAVVTEAAPVAESTTNDAATPPNSDASDMRDELIAAAKEAAGEESAPVEAKADRPAKAEVASAESQMSAVARALRASKDREKQRLASKREEQSASSQLQQERAAIAREQAEIASQRAAIEAERKRYEDARKDISKYGEFSGKTQEQIAQELMMQGSPEHQTFVRQQEKLEALEAQLKEQQSAWQAHQEQLKSQQEQAARHHQIAQERSFIEHTGAADKYPAASKLPPSVRLSWGYEIANEYFKATNRVASDAEIAEYIESSLTGEAGSSGQGAKQTTASNGKAPTSRANGPRTLSNSMASERRSSPRPNDNNLSPEELRKELIAAAREAKMQSA